MSCGLSFEKRKENTDFVTTMKRIRNQALGRLIYLIYQHVSVFMSKACKTKKSVIGNVCLFLLGRNEPCNAGI